MTNEIWISTGYFKDRKAGTIFKLAEIDEKDLTFERNEDDWYGNAKIWNSEDSFSCDLKVPRSSLNKLAIDLGLKRTIPNNWLRFHGYSMNRMQKVRKYEQRKTDTEI